MGNIVIFGGTFNPIHLGHIEIINKVLAEPYTQKILVMPTSLPPHKISNCLACDADRFEMCRLAVDGLENVEVSDIELIRGGKSYTYDTLKQMKGIYPNARFSLVCGGDMIVTFKQWHRFEDILKLADIIAVRRVGIDNTEFDIAVRELINLGGVIDVLKGEICEISSTEIKNNITNREYLMRFLPEKVYSYIIENNLYSGD